jgi:hypothetical protein
MKFSYSNVLCSQDFPCKPFHLKDFDLLSRATHSFCKTTGEGVEHSSWRIIPFISLAAPISKPTARNAAPRLFADADSASSIKTGAASASS